MLITSRGIKEEITNSSAPAGELGSGLRVFSVLDPGQFFIWSVNVIILDIKTTTFLRTIDIIILDVVFAAVLRTIDIPVLNVKLSGHFRPIYISVLDVVLTRAHLGSSNAAIVASKTNRATKAS
jgi:hypothetical protein